MWHLFFLYSFFCFVLLNRCFSSSVVNRLCSPSEASALLQFKQSFQILDFSSCDTSVPKTLSWNASRDCCTWDGVTCDMLTGHVIGLDLSCSRLNGTIHPNSSLFQLHHLHTLTLLIMISLLLQSHITLADWQIWGISTFLILTFMEKSQQKCHTFPI